MTDSNCRSPGYEPGEMVHFSNPRYIFNFLISIVLEERLTIQLVSLPSLSYKYTVTFLIYQIFVKLFLTFLLFNYHFDLSGFFIVCKYKKVYLKILIFTTFCDSQFCGIKFKSGYISAILLTPTDISPITSIIFFCHSI